MANQTAFMPPEFPVVARAMGISEAAAHFQRCTRTIRQWAAMHGDGLLEAMQTNGRTNSTRGGAMGARRARTKPQPEAKQEPIDRRAMAYIQRKTRWVCYSSRIHGDTKDVYYVVGNRRLTLGELIELAERHGFESQAPVRSPE